MREFFTQFPHCDRRVLHAPGECEYCDRHPDWQELRKKWGIAFTGHEPITSDFGASKRTQLPCPADFNRPPDTATDHRRWAGNVATSEKPVNETAASMMLYGPPAYDLVIIEEPVTPATATATVGQPPVPIRWLKFRRRRR